LKTARRTDDRRSLHGGDDLAQTATHAAAVERDRRSPSPSGAEVRGRARPMAYYDTAGNVCNPDVMSGCGTIMRV
jgi:hypothetical protein